LDKDFKTQWANIATNDISNFDKLIALIPSELIAFYKSNKDILQPPPTKRQWKWQRPIKIIRHNALKIIKTIDLYEKQGRFDKDFVPIERNVLFIFDTRYGGNNDSPWTSDNYRVLIQNIERWATKNVLWNVVTLLPPNLPALNALNNEYNIRHTYIGRYMFPKHIAQDMVF
jgi:hypothetical protein